MAKYKVVLDDIEERGIEVEADYYTVTKEDGLKFYTLVLYIDNGQWSRVEKVKEDAQV